MSTPDTIESVPLLDLSAQYQQIAEEVKEAIDRVLNHQQFIMGPEVDKLEEQIASYVGTRFAISCASGSDALLLSLMALDIEPGDYVLTTSFTFFATAGAIARLGAVPIFLDIDQVSYNIDPQEVEDFLSGIHPLCERYSDYEKRTKAIIPVHLYGQMADMDPLIEIADRYELAIVEDAAQAIGAEYKGNRAGSIGTFGCFSFFPSKNLGAYGDAGIITTNDEALAEKASILRLHGAKPKYHHSLVGINSRLDSIQAAVLLVKLNYLEEWSHQRISNANTYRALLRDTDLVSELGQFSCSDSCKALFGSSCDFNNSPNSLVLPAEKEGASVNGGRHVYHQFVIRTGSRDRVKEVFNAHGIGNSVYYPVPMHEQECFSKFGYQPSDCPKSYCASRQTIALPMFPELTTEQQKNVVAALEEALLPK